MIRITTSTSAAAAIRYFDEGLAREGPGDRAADYYLESPETHGVWGGKGAARLGLSGTVTRDQFAALARNEHPDGGRLTPRTKDTRRVGWDWTFNSIKSASIAYEVTRDPRILDAFHQAVREQLDQEIELQAATRVRKGVRTDDQATGELTYCTFNHLETRPVGDDGDGKGTVDCHLHAHVFIFNTTWDPIEQRHKAVELAPAVRDKGYHQAAFQARYARALSERGIPCVRTESAFEIAGIERETVEKFSRRTAEIEAYAREHGITDKAARDRIGQHIRKAKQQGLSRDDMRALYLMRLTDEEKASIRRALAGETGTEARRITPGEAVSFARDRLFERQAVVPESKLMAEALRHGVCSVTPEEIRREMEKRRGEFITRETGGRLLTTTREALAEEAAMIGRVRDGLGTQKPPVADAGSYDLSGLEAGQRTAVRHLWESCDRFTAISGAPGVGKTHLLKTAVKGIEAGGKRVLAIAPTSGATEVLHRDGFEAGTLQRFLADPKLQERVAGQVVILDEAGLASTKDLARFTEIIERQRARAVFSGDTRQHAGVQRSDGLRILERSGVLRTCDVADIRRQKGAYRSAVEKASRGDLEGAFDRLEAMGAVRTHADPAGRYQALANDFLDAVEKKKDVLAIAPTRAEGREVARAIRDGMRVRGLLGEEEHTVTRLTSRNLTEAERGSALYLRPGDTIVFHQNARGDIRRGSRWTIDAVAGDGTVRLTGQRGEATALPLDQAGRYGVFETGSERLAVGDRLRITANGRADGGKRLVNGRIFTVTGFTRSGDILTDNRWVIPKSFGHLDRDAGWCATSHASQGKTVDHVLIAQSEASLPATNREQFLVSISRGREAARIYCDDASTLRTAVQRSGERMAASEIAHAPTPRRGLSAWLDEHTERMRRLAGQARAYASRQIETARDQIRDRAGRATQQVTARMPQTREIAHHGR